MTTQVIVAPMRRASFVLMAGKVVMRQRKYSELERMAEERPRRPICAAIVSIRVMDHKMPTYHPAIASLSIHQPPCDLPTCLNNQQAAKTLQELKQRRRPHQRLLPSIQGNTLHDTSPTQQPQFNPTILLRLERPLHPTRCRIIRVDRKLIHAPYHQCQDGDPLRVLD